MGGGAGYAVSMRDDQISDETLLARIGGHDHAALVALYDRYAAGALAVALLLTGERPAAERIVEQLFWSLWRGELALTGRSPRNSLMLAARRLAQATPYPAT